MSSRSEYVELRARSAFSFLEGASPPEELAEGAAALGYDAIALGDRDGLYGAPRFYQAAKDAGVRAIVGAELVIDEGELRHGRDLGDAGPALCAGAGSRTLPQSVPHDHRLQAAAAAYKCGRRTEISGQGREPDHAGGSRTLWRGDDMSRRRRYQSARAQADTRRGSARALRLAGRIFGSGDLFLDLQRHLDPDKERLNRKLIGLAASARVPIVATNNVSFMRGAAGSARTVARHGTS